MNPVAEAANLDAAGIAEILAGDPAARRSWNAAAAVHSVNGACLYPYLSGR